MHRTLKLALPLARSARFPAIRAFSPMPPDGLERPDALASETGASIQIEMILDPDSFQTDSRSFFAHDKWKTKYFSRRKNIQAPVISEAPARIEVAPMVSQGGRIP